MTATEKLPFWASRVATVNPAVPPEEGHLSILRDLFIEIYCERYVPPTTT